MPRNIAPLGFLDALVRVKPDHRVVHLWYQDKRSKRLLVALGCGEQ